MTDSENLCRVALLLHSRTAAYRGFPASSRIGSLSRPTIGLLGSEAQADPALLLITQSWMMSARPIWMRQNPRKVFLTTGRQSRIWIGMPCSLGAGRAMAFELRVI